MLLLCNCKFLSQNEPIFLIDIPTPETTTVIATLQHGHFSVNVHIDKVWPTPVCEILFEV